MKRFVSVVVLSLIFTFSISAGIIPITGYAGCDGPGYQAFQDDVTMERFCCAPGYDCPFMAEKQQIIIIKSDSQITFKTIFLRLGRFYFVA